MGEGEFVHFFIIPGRNVCFFKNVKTQVDFLYNSCLDGNKKSLGRLPLFCNFSLYFPLHLQPRGIAGGFGHRPEQ